MAWVKPATHRPTGYSRTLEASAFFNALRRKGWTWDGALVKASEVFLVSEREIRRGSTITPMNVASDDDMARFALAKKGKTLEDFPPPT